MKKLITVLFGLCVVCSLAVIPVMAEGVSQNTITTPASHNTSAPSKKHRKGMKRHGRKNHKKQQNAAVTTQTAK